MHQAGARILEHLCLDEGVFDQTRQAASDLTERARLLHDGSRGGKDAEMTGDDEGEDDGRAPEHDEHERIGGHVGEDREHQFVSSASIAEVPGRPNSCWFSVLSAGASPAGSWGTAPDAAEPLSA